MIITVKATYCCFIIVSQYHPASIYNIYYTLGNSSQLFEGRVTNVRYFMSFFHRNTIPQRITRTPCSDVGCASVAGDAGTVGRAAEAGTGAAVATWTCTLT